MAEQTTQDKWLSVLNDYKEKEFVQRILNPELNPALIMEGEQGQSHRMRAESDENGNWYVFPSIVNMNGKLYQFKDATEAMKYAIRTGEYIPFEQDKDSAIDFSKNYKTQNFIDYFRR